MLIHTSADKSGMKTFECHIIIIIFFLLLRMVGAVSNWRKEN